MKKKINYFIFWGILCLIVIITILRFFYIIQNNNQLEFREGVGLKFAVDFSNGINPYGLKNLEKLQPPEISIYGFLSPLIAAPFIKLLSFLRPIIVAQLLNFFIESISIILFGKIIYNILRSKILAAFGSLFFYCCFYRCGAVAGFFPDQLGIFLSILLFFFIVRDKLQNEYKPLLYDFFIILLFYTKSYYVFLGFGVLLFLLINSTRNGIKFLIYGIILGLISIFLVQLVFPLYFSETIAIAFCMVSGDNVSSEIKNSSLLYSLKQFYFLFKDIFLIFFILFIYNIILHLVKIYTYFYHNKKMYKRLRYLFYKIKSFFKSYSFCQLTTMLLPTIYFGQNNGAYLSYHLQLWFPYFMFIGILITKNVINSINYIKSKFVFRYTIKMFILFFLFIFFSNFLLFKNNICSFISLTCPSFSENNIKKENWDIAINLLNKYNDLIFPSPLIGNYCIENDTYGYNTNLGQSTGSDYGITMYENNKFLKFFCPYAGLLMEQSLNFSKLQIENIKNKLYSCIVIPKVTQGLLTEDFLSLYGYKKYTELELFTGSQKWITYFYVRE